MNKKGFSNSEFINIIRIVATLVLIYVVYKAIMAQLGGG